MTETRLRSKEALERVGELRSQSQRLARRITELEQRCGKLTATYGVQARGGGVTPEDIWALLCDEKGRLQRQMVRLARAQRLVERQVDKVGTELGRMVLRYRGLDRMDWEQTAREIEKYTGHLYSCSRLRTVYREALEELEDKWPAP
jgi:hypothetical protein